jgi:hypothetical protein
MRITITLRHCKSWIVAGGSSPMRSKNGEPPPQSGRERGHKFLSRTNTIAQREPLATCGNHDLADADTEVVSAPNVTAGYPKKSGSSVAAEAA